MARSDPSRGITGHQGMHNFSGRSEAWLSRQSGGLEITGSNPVVPTNLNRRTRTWRRNKDNFCKQCVLQRGDWVQVAWIPEKFAQLNKYLKIGDEDGWQVVSIGGRRAQAEVNERSRDHLKQRVGSDI